ncbi:hypothetical protein UC35_09055 [Ramlibacter tataouinensis]|uniref:Uncharacterized protein n=1 Tax=Ramlibacter tataouinensis TaxID=94132 RepID=A0A127JST7_9BURK|nr:hypothetical protein UC35_09055 [Ramlibacter tataouinensis]
MSAATPLVAITESSAKPVAANALDNVMKAAATRATGLPLGVQVDLAALGGTGALQALTTAARLGAASIAGAQLPVGVAIDRTTACPAGGSLTVTGNVASTAAVVAGDTLTVTHHNCRINQAGVVLTFNGQVAIEIINGTLTDTLPFHVVMQSTVTNLSVQAGSSLAVSNGDARIDWSATSVSSQTLLATGQSLATRETISGGATRNTVLRDYAQGLAISGTVATATLSGTIETNSPQLGTTASTYMVSTPAAVVWDPLAGVVAAGTLRVVGARGAQFTLTFTVNNVAQILLDENGDGSADRTITTNLTELSGLL